MSSSQISSTIFLSFVKIKRSLIFQLRGHLYLDSSHIETDSALIDLLILLDRCARAECYSEYGEDNVKKHIVDNCRTSSFQVDVSSYLQTTNDAVAY